jgi:hypothetical protein
MAIGTKNNRMPSNGCGVFPTAPRLSFGNIHYRYIEIAVFKYMLVYRKYDQFSYLSVIIYKETARKERDNYEGKEPKEE